MDRLNLIQKHDMLELLNRPSPQTFQLSRKFRSILDENILIKYYGLRNMMKEESNMSFKMINVKDVKAQKILGGPIKPIVTPQTVGSKKLRFAIGVFDPDEGLVPHIHPESEEVYYVIKGRGIVYIGEERKEIPIEPETALYIPPGTIHGVKNTGKEKLIVAFFVAPGGEPAEVVGE